MFLKLTRTIAGVAHTTVINSDHITCVRETLFGAKVLGASIDLAGEGDAVLVDQTPDEIARMVNAAVPARALKAVLRTTLSGPAFA